MSTPLPPPPLPSSELRVRVLQTFPLSPDLPLLRRITRSQSQSSTSSMDSSYNAISSKTKCDKCGKSYTKNTFQSISVCKILYLYLYLRFIFYRNTERFCILYFILIDNKYIYILCINICVLFLNLAGPCLSCLFENNIKSKLDKNGIS